MVKVSDFYACLKENDIEFFVGVPDSLLKSFCAFVKDNTPKSNNIITANEGNALSIAAGYHLATNKIALVYMQNSGLGNIVNPTLSLMDPMVYNIPALLLVGWRGEPGRKDEPQHIKQGTVTLSLLQLLGIRYSIIGQENTISDIRLVVNNAKEYMRLTNEPYALVVKKDTFEYYKTGGEIIADYNLSREEAIGVIATAIGRDDIIISTTGMSSRELFEYRENMNQTHDKDFLTVGSMGHASQIALGVAIGKPDKRVYCIDGDGSFIMHMGGSAIIGQSKRKNLVHIVINNGAHDSVGGQKTVGYDIDMISIAKACGYELVIQAKSKEEIIQGIAKSRQSQGVTFIEIKTKKGNRDNLGRPTTTPLENKQALMSYLLEGEI